jgi:glycosyltransferase involved in cell wall biosynthesis
MEVWFWQLIISPHMANLAKSLGQLGYRVTFVAQREMSLERAAQGWIVPDVGLAKIVLAPDNEAAVALAKTSSKDSIHICQGVRANGVIGPVQKILKVLERKQFVIMETVNDSGWKGIIKRALYRYILQQMSPYILGILANGINTRDWLVKRGVSTNKIFPFSYFLPEILNQTDSGKRFDSDRYRILFVGNFVENKRLDLLILAISRLASEKVELAVVGSGPLEGQLKKMAVRILPGRVDWIGSLLTNEVRVQMQQADCLVLPSRHDGWGAVVSESLMSGTPVICSNTCGAAVVVNSSGYGGVFESGNIIKLVKLLSIMVAKGKLTIHQSNDLAKWARCLSGPAGAKYLHEILKFTNGTEPIPLPPWCSSPAKTSKVRKDVSSD